MTINKLGLDQDDTGEPVIEQTAVMLPGGTPHCPTYPPRADAVPKEALLTVPHTLPVLTLSPRRHSSPSHIPSPC